MVNTSRRKRNQKGFTLVEVIVVAVIVAVLALVGIQLYQGYVTEARRNTAENLASSAASYLQTFVNSQGVAFVTTGGHFPTLNGPASWAQPLNPLIAAVPAGGACTDPSCVSFTCPANAVVTFNAAGTVSATVNPGNVQSTGIYRWMPEAAGGGS